MVQPVSKHRSVSCNGTGWFSQNPRIGESVVMVQGGPASSKDRSVNCNGTGWSSEYLRIGPSVVMVQGDPASI